FHLLSNSNKATKNKYLERVNLWQNCGGISGTKGGGKWRTHADFRRESEGIKGDLRERGHRPKLCKVASLGVCLLYCRRLDTVCYVTA
ncbi:unnamed protein product, partial [Brassica rapa subsp. trilocularis]